MDVFHTINMAQRIGAFWTREEETRLLASSTSGVSLKTIAQQHQRTLNGIKSRLERIAYNYMAEGKSVAEAARLTGLPIHMIQRAGAPASESNLWTFKQTVSRSELQAIPIKRRLEAIQKYVDNFIYNSVYEASALGKTSYLHPMPKPQTQPHVYQLTSNDLVEGCTAKFPGCKVSFSEEWVDVRPGVREHRSGILIDWS